jgi:hypothetical protein
MTSNLFTKIDGVNYSVDDILSKKNGNTANTSKFSSSGIFDLANTNTANNLLNINTSLNYKIGSGASAKDFSTVFSPVYYDYTSTNTTDSNTVTIPLWCKNIGFVVIGSGGDGNKGYYDTWDSVATYSTTPATWTTYTVWNQEHSYKVFDYKWRSNYTWYFTSNITANAYNSIATYANNYQRYTGSGGGGGSCVAGVFNNTDKKATRITLSIDNTKGTGKYSIQFNDSVTSVANAFNGSSVAAVVDGGVQNRTDVVGNFKNANFTSGTYTNTLSTENTANTSSYQTNQGSFSYVYMNTGSNGSAGSAGASTTILSSASYSTSFGEGGNSGYNNSTSIIQDKFMPVISGNYGKGATGTNTTSTSSGNNGIIRYWFLA